MKAPADVVVDPIWVSEDIPGGWAARAYRNPDGHEKACEVYWGSHGCARPHGHEGDHWCDCCECDDHPADDAGCVAGPPYYGPDTRFYGDDAERLGLPPHDSNQESSRGD